MRCISLQSGSNGNSIYLEALGTRLLFDAGISGSRAEERLATHGIRIREVDALIVSHDHRDHSSCAGIFQRKFGIPIYFSEGTFACCRGFLGKTVNVNTFKAGDSIRIGSLCVHTIRTPHDGVDGVGFFVESSGKRLGILTDLGHVFDGLSGVLQDLDAVVLESNHDEEMLRTGPYPAILKARVRGPGGHLSNRESADLVSRSGKRLQWIALAHLSGENNRPELAIETHRNTYGSDLPIHLAGREAVSEIWEVR